MKRILLLFTVLLLLASASRFYVRGAQENEERKEILQTKGDSVPLFFKYSGNFKCHQSASCYGIYAISITDTMTRFSLYDMREKKTIGKFRQEGRHERFNGGVVFHSNNSFFGKEKYSQQDELPLFYVSHRENETGRGQTHAYRIIPHVLKKNNEKKDSLSVILAQVIFFPKMTDKNAMGSPWATIDEKGEYIYTYSRNNRKGSSNNGVCRISKFKMPELGRDTVYFDDDDIEESFTIQNLKLGLAQGGCVYKNHLYIMQGVPKRGNLYLRVIDLKTKSLEKTYELKSYGLRQEPQGCFIYGENLMFSTNNGEVYQFDKRVLR